MGPAVHVLLGLCSGYPATSLCYAERYGGNAEREKVQRSQDLGDREKGRRVQAMPRLGRVQGQGYGQGYGLDRGGHGLSPGRHELVFLVFWSSREHALFCAVHPARARLKTKGSCSQRLDPGTI